MKKIYYGNIVAASSFIIWLTAWGTYSTFSVFLKPVIEELGWERADIALVYSMSSLVQAASALGMGKLTDKLGPRLVVTIFGSFLALSYFLLSKVTVLWQYHFAYALIGAIGLSTATVPIMITIARWFTKDRGIVSGLVQSGMGIGGLIFSPLAGLMITKYDWRTAYVCLCCITLPLIIISGLFLKKDPGELSNYKVEILQKEKNFENTIIKGLSLSKAIRTKQFWMIAGMFLSFGFCRCSFLAHTAAHVQDLGYSLIDAANVMAVLTFSSIIGRVGVGFLADKIGSRYDFFFCYGIMCGGLLLGKFASDFWCYYFSP